MTKVPKPFVGAAFDSLQLVKLRVGSDKARFMTDPILQDATLMRLMDAGEQLARLRDSYLDYYETHATPSWSKLIGLRNIIAHGYLAIDYETVWNIIQNYLPPADCRVRGVVIACQRTCHLRLKSSVSRQYLP